jgi:hypothetical protein
MVCLKNVSAEVSFANSTRKNPGRDLPQGFRRPRFSFSIFNCQRTDKPPKDALSTDCPTCAFQPV